MMILNFNCKLNGVNVSGMPVWAAALGADSPSVEGVAAQEVATSKRRRLVRMGMRGDQQLARHRDLDSETAEPSSYLFESD
jgi:hypothetical protein